MLNIMIDRDFDVLTHLISCEMNVNVSQKVKRGLVTLICE